MRLNNWKKIKTNMIMLTVAMSTMLGTTAHLLANEVQVPQISQWAIGTLNEGENYGIYPITWYYDGFQKPITEEKFQQLVKETGKKVENLGFKKSANFKPEVFKAVGTRENVIKALYNIVAQYELPEELEVGKSDAIAYFQKRNILSGTKNGLELDKPCTVEQAVVFATKLVEDTYRAIDAGSKGFLWKVQKNQNTVYLLGSIHMGDSDLYPIAKPLKDAFKASDELVVEANLGNQAGMEEFIKTAMYQDGTTLKDHVSKEIYDKALKVFEITGIPAETYIQFKPWSITNDLNVIMNSKVQGETDGTESARLGIDRYFMNTAIVDQKPVVELEGLKFQGELFDSLTPAFQEQQLNGLLDGILAFESETSNKKEEVAKPESQEDDFIQIWQKQWQKGNIAEFKDSYVKVVQDSTNEMDKMLFGKRDQNMATKITEFLEKEGKTTYFVVVGAGHLTVKDTVIDQLTSKGYTVEVVK
ncbi:MAG: TraB/GumN family protein [Cellulosilyticaceae bacterium]